MEQIEREIGSALNILRASEQECLDNGYDTNQAANFIAFKVHNLIEINRDLEKENAELKKLIKDKLDEAKWELISVPQHIVSSNSYEFIFRCSKCGRIVSIISKDNNATVASAEVYALNPFCNCGARMKI